MCHWYTHVRGSGERGVSWSLHGRSRTGFESEGGQNMGNWFYDFILASHSRLSEWFLLPHQRKLLHSGKFPWCHCTRSLSHRLRPLLSFCFLFCFVLRCYLFVYFWPCPVACRILFPRPGIKPSTSAVKVQSLNNHWTTREVPCLFLFLKNQVLFFKLFAFYWSMADLIILG